MVEKEKKQQETTSEFKLVEVPTQMGLAVRTPEGETITEAQLLVEVANRIIKLEKAVVG